VRREKEKGKKKAKPAQSFDVLLRNMHYTSDAVASAQLPAATETQQALRRMDDGAMRMHDDHHGGGGSGGGGGGGGGGVNGFHGDGGGAHYRPPSPP
jgi:hypothetical protein